MKGLLIIIIVFGFAGIFSIVIPEIRNAFQALRRQRQREKERERARVRHLALPAPAPVPEEPEEPGPAPEPEEPASEKPVAPPPAPPVPPVPSAPPVPPPVQVSRRPVRKPVEDQVEQLSASVLAEVIGDKSEGAARLWEEARKMPHAAVPDPEKDAKYLKTLAVAARLGHVEAMKELGTCANKRKKVVEANFWLTLAELKGVADIEQELRVVRAHWLAKGCPREYDNVRDDFTKDDGSFSRAVLHLRSGKAFRHACESLTTLSGKGHKEAKLYMEKNRIRPMTPLAPDSKSKEKGEHHHHHHHHEHRHHHQDH